MAPGQAQSLILAIRDEVGTGAGTDAVCRPMLAYMDMHMKNSFSTFFSEQYLAGESVGGSMEFLLSALSTGSTSTRDICTDYLTNPYVVSILPNPIDYFRPCGMTTTCKTRCGTEIQAFEEANRISVYKPITKQYTAKVRTPFFLDNDEAAKTPGTLLSIAELTGCSVLCGGAMYRCVAVAGLPTDTSDLTVTHYCIPLKAGVGIRKASPPSAFSWSIQGSNTFATRIVSVAFTDVDMGSALVILRQQQAHRRLDYFDKANRHTFYGDLYPPPSPWMVMDVPSSQNLLECPEQHTCRPREIRKVLVSSSGPVDTTIFLQVEAEVSDAGGVSATQTFTLCTTGLGVAAEWRSCVCCTLWEEASLGHAVSLSPASPGSSTSSGMIIVPGGGLLSTSKGLVKVLTISPHTGAVTNTRTVPFQASTWILTSGIPPVADNRVSSFTGYIPSNLRSLVSQTGV